MARLDRRWTGFDVIRIFDQNLDINSKRLVIAYFFSTLPLKEPKVDVLQFILDVAGLIPVAGTAGKIFELSIATAQVIKEVAELFGLEFEDLEVELAQLKLELETVEEELKRRLDELNEVRIQLDNSEEQNAALRGTIELLEDEIRDLVQQVQAVPGELRTQIRGFVGALTFRGNRILEFVPRLPPGEPRAVIRTRATEIVRIAENLGRIV